MESNYKNTEILDFVAKYLSGNATAEEIYAVDNWKKENAANEKLFAAYNKLWVDMDKVKSIASINIDSEWKKIESKLNTTSTIDFKPQHRSYKSLLKFAAIAVFAIISSAITYFYISKNNYQQLATINKSKEIDLTDGSTITLNTRSVLLYPEKFAEKKRNVKLQGSAHFKIAPDKSKPFIIDLNDIIVEVVGTSFYINAPENDSANVEIIVESGIVAVSRKDDSQNKVLLQAGNKVVYSRTEHSIVKSENNDLNYLAWKTKKLVFKNKKLTQIINDINKAYNCSILLDNNLNDCRLTVTFDNQTLETVLTILQSTLDLEVKKSTSGIELKGEGC